MKTLPKKTQQIWAMESGDTEKKPEINQLRSSYRLKNGIQQRGSTVGLAFSCTFYGQRHCAGRKEPIYAEMTIILKPILSYACLLIEEDDGEIGVSAKSRMSYILLPLRVLSCIETLVGHVMYLKGLIADSFKSSELLHLLRLNGRVGTIPTD